MNKEFIKKMIKAEILRYEAIKEILPDSLKDRVTNFEKNAAELMKELALDFISDSTGMESHSQSSGEGKKTKKVEVDFSMEEGLS